MYIFSKIERIDIYTIADIGEQSLPIYYTIFHLLEILRDPSYIVYKCTLDNIIIGFVILKIYAETHVHIMSIAISKRHRNKGCGTEFLNFLKDTFEHYQITLYVQIWTQLVF